MKKLFITLFLFPTLIYAVMDGEEFKRRKLTRDKNIVKCQRAIEKIVYFARPTSEEYNVILWLCKRHENYMEQRREIRKLCKENKYSYIMELIKKNKE